MSRDLGEHSNSDEGERKRATQVDPIAEVMHLMVVIPMPLNRIKQSVLKRPIDNVANDGDGVKLRIPLSTINNLLTDGEGAGGSLVNLLARSQVKNPGADVGDAVENFGLWCCSSHAYSTPLPSSGDPRRRR